MRRVRPEIARDPICGKSLDTGRLTRSSRYKGKVYFFCSPACQDQFERAPERVIKPRNFMGRFLDRLASAAERDFGTKGPCCH